MFVFLFVWDQSGGSRGQVVDPRGEQFRWLSSQLLCPPLLDNSSQSVCTLQADVSDCVFDATAHEPVFLEIFLKKIRLQDFFASLFVCNPSILNRVCFE